MHQVRSILWPLERTTRSFKSSLCVWKFERSWKTEEDDWNWQPVNPNLDSDPQLPEKLGYPWWSSATQYPPPQWRHPQPPGHPATMPNNHPMTIPTPPPTLILCEWDLIWGFFFLWFVMWSFVDFCLWNFFAKWIECEFNSKLYCPWI